jgi:hypothetical protein
MELFLTCDAHWESGVENIIDELYDNGFEDNFIQKEYGNTLNGISVVLMCQNPDLNLKQRIKYSKKEQKVYIDIMLDLNKFKNITALEKKKIIQQKMLDEIPNAIVNKKIADFKTEEFIADLKNWFEENNK